MGLEILILKKATEYASLKMLMEISGKDPIWIYKSIMFSRIKETKGFNFLRKGKVTVDLVFNIFSMIGCSNKHVALTFENTLGTFTPKPSPSKHQLPIATIVLKRNCNHVMKSLQ